MKKRKNNDFKFVWEHTKKDWHWARFLVIVLANFLIVYLAIFYTNLQALIIDAGLNFQPGKEIATDWLTGFLISGIFGARGSYQLVIALAIVFSLNIALLNTLKFWKENAYIAFSNNIKFSMRMKTFDKLLYSNKKINNGEAFVILNEDMVALGHLVYNQVPSIIMDIFYIVMAAITLLSINAYLLIVPLVAMPLILYVAIRYSRKIYQVQLTIRRQNAKLKMLTQDNIEGIKDIKLFNTTEYALKKLSASSKKHANLAIKKGYTDANYVFIFNIIQRSSYAISLIVGGILAIYGLISIGQFLVFTGFVSLLLTHTVNIITNYANTRTEVMRIRRLQRFFNSADDVKEIKNPQVLDAGEKHTLEIKNLNLKDGKAFVLKDINFFLPEGKSLGIVSGLNDGGKTLTSTFERSLTQDDGQVLIGDVQNNHLAVSNLRDLFSVHLENTMLFNISIANNLKFSGCKVTDEKIAEVLKSVFCTDVLLQVKNGLGYVVQDNGNEFGTFKSRLSISRAILKDAPFYIFQDFSLGYSDEEKKHLCKNILKLLPEKSAIFTADDFDVVKNCDYCLVLEKGKVKYFGESKMYAKMLKGGLINE